MKSIILLISLPLLALPSRAYIDTTRKDFQKPQPIQVKAFHYEEPIYEKYIDVAAEKVAPKVLTNLMGPVGVLLNLSDKLIKMKEEKEQTEKNL